MTRRIFIIGFLWLLCFALKAQKGSSFITNFSAETYQASPQIWGIAQDSLGLIYFGSGTGLTRYDGARWASFPVANSTTVRSLAVGPGPKIYTGAKGEIGYFEPDGKGSLRYVSLAQYIPEKYKLFADVWHTFYWNGKAYFASFEYLFVWDGKQLKTILAPPPSNGFRGGMMANGQLFFKHQTGLVRVAGDTIVPMPKEREVIKLPSAQLCSYAPDTFLIVSGRAGLHLYIPKDTLNPVVPIATADTAFFSSPNNFVYKCEPIPGGYIFGSLSKGAVITNKKGQIIERINKAHGMQEDVVYSFLLDRQQNVWIGTNNGLSFLERSSAIRNFYAGYGISGQALSMRRLDGTLFVGTTTGLFYWDESSEQFKPAPNMSAIYCWALEVIDGKLLAGTNTGLYWANKEARAFAGLNLQVYTIYRKDDRLLLGTTEGLYTFVKDNEEWKPQGRIGDIKDPLRSVAQDPEGNIWVGTNFRGIYRIKPQYETLKDSLIQADILKLDTAHGLPLLTANYVHLLGDKVHFATATGMRAFADGKFQAANPLGFPDTLHKLGIYPMVVAPNADIWLGGANAHSANNTTNSVYWLRKGTNGYTAIQQPFLRFPASMIDEFLPEDSLCWIGSSEGLFAFDKHWKNDGVQLPTAFISGFYHKAAERLSVTAPQTLRYAHNSVSFEFGAPFFEDVEQTQYQYLLEGNDEEWSDWSKASSAHYTNLFEGDYRFRVRAKDVYGNLSHEASYSFSIAPPLYRTWWAYMVYALLIGMAVWGIVRWNAARLRLEKIRLEALVRERTAQIRQKSAELAQQKEEISAINEALLSSYDIIAKKNQGITDSITYASRIQRAILPSQDRLNTGLGRECTLFYQPRDIVSGDFYWFQEIDGKQFLVVADCTGHGVPGAFMSMIGSALLDQFVMMMHIHDPATLLACMHDGVIASLNQDENANQDGMDMAVCMIDRETGTLHFAGAKNPLIYIKDGKAHEIEASRRSVGGKYNDKMGDFQTHILPIEKGLQCFLFSDGYQDQFGGPEGKKFMKRRFRELLASIASKSAQEQQNALADTMHQWMNDPSGPYKQVDDMLVIGFGW